MMTTSNKPEQFYILDGTSFAYRSFFAIQNLSNSQGQPTNAVYGFVRALQKILHEHKPDYIAVSFDLAAPTFRHAEFADYKAHRQAMPQELVIQLPLIRELLHAYRIPVLEMQGFEADDVMGTMAAKARACSVHTTICTGDKDMMQFVDEAVSVMSSAKEGTVYDAKAVKEKFGVEPARIPHVLALMGDSSDNVPGVPGIGPKTASALIVKFGDVQGLYDHLEDIASRSVRESLAAHRDRVFANLRLVHVRTDVPLSATIQDCRRAQPDREKLADLFKRLEFTALMKDFMEAAPRREQHALLIDNPHSLADMIKKVQGAGEFVLDLITTDVHPMRGKILGAVFCPQDSDVFYVSLGDSLPLEEFLRQAKDVLSDPSIGKVGHDLKYDAVVLLRHNILLQGIRFDTMLSSYLLNPSKLRHGSGELALEFLNERMSTIADMLGSGKASRGMEDVPVPERMQFAAGESAVIRRLKSALEPLLETRELDCLFHEVEIPLEIVLARMENRGICVDRDILHELSKEFESQIGQLTEQIYRLAGGPFNIASTKELGVILFEKLGLPKHRKTKTGYSTDSDVLTSLAKGHDLPLLVLNYRALCKLKSTYSDALPVLVNPATGAIHTSFNQTVTATGRLSSSEPNLQNIPVKTDMGLRIRSAFVPRDKDSVFLGADYSQIELRILAHFSEDENLMEAFRQDRDVHRHTAGLVFGVPLDQVSEDQRRRAKIVNFGILYGMGAFSLARDMDIGQAEAQSFIDAYFERYHGVRDFIQQVLAKAHREKFVTTILGRRRYLPEISSSNFSLRQFAERTAINTVVQGSSADIIKMAMLEVDKCLEPVHAQMLLQIHDELVFEVNRKDVTALEKLVHRKMEEVVYLKVTLKVDVHVGKNWAEL